MSFIFQDKNILNLIYKLAADPEPQSPAVPASLIKSLFNNLSKYKPTEFSLLSGEGQFASVSIQSLSSLTSLIENLAVINKVKFKGESLAYRALDVPPNLKKDLYKTYKTYYVYPEGLKNYLKLLLSSPDYRAKPLYREMLNRLIGEANKELSLGLEVPDVKDQEIYKFKSSIDLGQVIQNNSGDKSLSLSNLNKLSEWLTKNSITIVSDGKPIDNEASKICSFLQYLFNNFPRFQDQIQASATQNNCGTLQAAPGQQTPAQPGKASAPGGAPGGNAALAVMLQKELESGAPYYDEDAIIFEQGERGIIPFLERVKQFSPKSFPSCDALIANFKRHQSELSPEGEESLSANVYPEKVIRLINFNPPEKREALRQSLDNQFRSDMNNLHTNIVAKLCRYVFPPEKAPSIENHLLALKSNKGTIIGQLYHNAKVRADSRR